MDIGWPNTEKFHSSLWNLSGEIGAVFPRPFGIKSSHLSVYSNYFYICQAISFSLKKFLGETVLQGK